jgi:hypothetical protein
MCSVLTRLIAYVCMYASLHVGVVATCIVLAVAAWIVRPFYEGIIISLLIDSWFAYPYPYITLFFILLLFLIRIAREYIRF